MGTAAGHLAMVRQARFWHSGRALGNKSHNEFWKSREMLRSIDEFNRDVASANQTTIEAIKEATQRLLHSKESEKPDQWVHLGQIKEFERLAQVRAAASELAKTLDRRLKWSLRMLLFGLFLALACFHFYAHHIVEGAPHPTHRPIFLGLFLLVLLVLAGLVAVVWYWRGDDRRLDYRALAEALRVRYFWGLAGLTRSVAGTYMGQLEGEMSWARRALYAVSPHPHEWQRIYESRSASDQEECLKAVASRWVSDQKNYYHRAHSHAHNWSTGLRLTGLLLALTGWGLSAHLFLAGWLFRCEQLPTSQRAAAAGEPTVAVPSGASASSIGDLPHSAAPGATAEVAKQGDTGRGPDARHPEPFVLIFSSLLVISGGLIIAYGEHGVTTRTHDSTATCTPSSSVARVSSPHSWLPGGGIKPAT